MKALERQNLQTVFSTSLCLFCFLSSFICCWLFPQHRESAAISLDGDGIGFCLIPFMSPPLRWGGGMQVAPCASGLLIVSLVPHPSQPDLQAPARHWPGGAFVESAGQHGCLWFGVGKGILCHSSALFWSISFFLQAYLGRCSECSDKINMVLEVAFFQGKVFKDMLPGKHFISQSSILPRWTRGTSCTSECSVVLYILWDSEEFH